MAEPRVVLTQFEQEILDELRYAGEVVDSPHEERSVPEQLGYCNENPKPIYRALRILCQEGLATVRDLENHRSLMSKQGRQRTTSHGRVYRACV